jgi:hypothetical protein
MNFNTFMMNSGVSHEDGSFEYELRVKQTGVMRHGPTLSHHARGLQT